MLDVEVLGLSGAVGPNSLKTRSELVNSPQKTRLQTAVSAAWAAQDPWKLEHIRRWLRGGSGKEGVLLYRIRSLRAPIRCSGCHGSPDGNWGENPELRPRSACGSGHRPR